MGFIIKIAALIIGAHLLQDPKACPCSQEQNLIISNEPVITYITEFTRTRCKLSINAKISIVPEGADIFDEFIVSMISSEHGLLNKQTMNGASTITMQDQVVLKKGETVWLLITSNTKSKSFVHITYL